MSEAEVKAEQFREHFSKMVEIFNLIINQILMKNIKNAISNDELNIWNNNLHGFIHIVEYPEHRMSVYRIVRSSFEHFSLNSVPKEQHT